MSMSSHSVCHRVLGLLIGLSLVACSSGTGGNKSGGQNDPIQASASITSPQSGLLVTSAFLTVYGTAEASRGGIDGVSVNGTGAATDDGFATWKVVVPLEEGNNELEVIVFDERRTRHAGQGLTVTRSSFIIENPIAIVTEHPKTWFIDDSREHGRRLVEVDMLSGETLVVFTAPGLRAEHLAFDPLRRHLLCVIHAEEPVAEDRLIAVDLASGSVQLLGSFAVAIDGIAFDPLRAGVLVLSAGLHAIDVANGSIILLSDGEGWSPVAIVFDSVSGRIVVASAADAGQDRSAELIAVDPTTGGRSVLASDSVGSGVVLGEFGPKMAYDAIAARILFESDGQLLVLDHASGTRSPIGVSRSGHFAMDVLTRRLVWMDALAQYVLDLNSLQVTATQAMEIGIGPRFATPVDGVLDAEGARLFVLDQKSGILAVELSTGARELVASDLRGRGPSFQVPDNIAYAADLGVLYVADSGLDAILAVDLLTGDRQIVSSSAVGSGLPLGVVRGLAMHPNGGLLFLGEALVHVDTETGDRTILALTGSVAGGGMAVVGSEVFVFGDTPELLEAIELETGRARVVASIEGLQAPRDLLVDELGERGLILDMDGEHGARLFDVDLITGLATMLSGTREDGELTGYGSRLWGATAMVRPFEDGAVFVLDRHWHSLVAVDTRSGDRGFVSR